MGVGSGGSVSCRRSYLLSLSVVFNLVFSLSLRDPSGPSEVSGSPCSSGYGSQLATLVRVLFLFGQRESDAVACPTRDVVCVAENRSTSVQD